MAKEWQKILDDFSGGKSSTSHSTSSQVSSSQNASSNNWQGILDNFSGSTSRKKQYDDAIAPVASRVITRAKKRKEEEEEEEKEKKRKWFEKGLFEDGYDIGDITKTILGSATDALENVGSGIIGMGEKAVDAMAYIAPYAENAQFYQNGGIYTLEQQKQHEKVVEQSKKGLGEFIAKDLYDEEKVAKAIISDPARKIGIDSESHSVFGEKSDSLIQSGGQLLATVGLGAAGLPWWAVTGATSFGAEAENAMNQGATYEQAGASAAISAGAEILSEKLSGGISFGGKSLDDALTKQLARGISNKLVRTAAKLGLDMAGEGAEEVFSQIASNLGSSLYKEEDITELLFNEEAMDGYLESFIGGAALGGVSNTYNAVKSNSKGVDYTSGLTKNEQKVVDKLYKDEIAAREKEGKVTQKEKSKIYDSILEDMEKGYISTDTIEEVLGGEKYNQYKQVAEWEDSLQTEFDKLNKMKQGEMTGEQVDRREALRTQLKNVKATSDQTKLRNQIRDEVMGLVKGDRLAESYNERARTGQKFEADVTQYDAKQQVVVQKAIDSGILNNSNRTHEFVDFVAKISADTGVLFDFSNTAKIREAGFTVEGQTVDGFITKDDITVNIDSPKSRQFVVGHEITHALEGSELYDALRTSVFDYAKMKNQYDSRMESIQKRYKEGTDFEAELTADLVGEYIFSDTDFINNLSTQNRNVFQKVYDEIKYLCKVATAGSKEARELEKVKRAFDKAYREGGKTQSETKYSVSETTDGRLVAVVDSDILSNIDTSSWDKTKKAEAKKAASEALKQFSNGIVVDGITRKVNRTSRREYTRSKDTEKLFNQATDVFADKMRAADVADDIVVATTNWQRDGGLKHPRTDDFVDFDHGNTLIASGSAKYSAEVVVGITDAGEAVLYDVVDMKPATFDVKKEESPTTATTQNAIGDIQGDSFADKVSQNGEDVKESLSAEWEQHTPDSLSALRLETTEDSTDIAPVAENATTTQEAPIYESNDKSAPEGQTAMFEPVEEKRTTRKEYHQSIIDNVKSIFKTKGFDFDKVLKAAKNLSTWSTVDNTPQRVMEKALGYKEGGILADITVNKVAQNETEGIKWLNKNVELLKQISKEYNIKPGSKKSAAAQMYAEGFYVDENNNIVQYGDRELAIDFPNPKDRQDIIGLARDSRIRKMYDDVLTSINESRTRNLYPEIPRLDNYFLHFRAMADTFSALGLPFNPNDIRAKDLPTDLNGVTADLKPGQPFFSSAMHRTGKRTSFDLLGGVERYLNSAKNQIYHIDDIQTLRALRNYIAETYGQATGLEDLDSLTDAEAEERIKQVYDSHLSTFAKFLNEEANVLAGKTALIDRGVEGIIGRRGITFLNTLNKQVGSNMVGYNISSSLTNFLPVAQTFAKTNKFDFTKAFAQTVLNKFSGGRFDSFAKDSPVVIRRKGEDRFYRTAWQKMADPGYALMGMVDDISTELIARTKYNEFTRKGMDSQKAHFETDKWVSKLMGDRSIGQQPQLFNSKMLGLVTKFQLEVRNQLDSQFYDTIQETKASNEHIQNGLARNAKTAAKVASVLTQLAVAQHLYGKAFESVAGYNPAFDIIEVLMTAFGYDDEEDSEDTVKDNLGQAFEAFMEDLPYASIITGGGRIPISSALPINELVQGKDQYGNDKSRWETLGEVAPYYLMPGGYGQAKKTVQGLKMFSDDHPIAGSYTEAGNLRFPVEDTVGNRIKAGIFGQYASENARKYFDEEQRTLNPEQTEIFAGLDIPIEEYWEYRDKYNEFQDVRDQMYEAANADGATEEDILRNKYFNSVNSDLSKLFDQQKEIAGSNSSDKQTKLRELQSQMEQLLSNSKYGADRIFISGAYGEVGDRRYNYDAEENVWYEIKPKKSNGDDNWFYIQEQLSHDKLGMSYEDFWNGKEPPEGGTYYAEYNGKRYNYDAEKNQWYEITPKNDDGSDNWYYQMEQEVTKGLGISYEEYWSKPKEYNYAYEKPGKYAISQAVGGYDSYMEYKDALENWQSDNYIGADKDSNGNSISGSRKKKVQEYINGLDLDYGEKIILYRTVYSSKDDKRAYNMAIIDYLNSRDDISYQEMETILEELEMEVDSKGNITW